MTGRILKGVGGFYYVLMEDGVTRECRARGLFRKRGVTPLPGDLVDVRVEGGRGYIEEIMPRLNTLARPAVSNLSLLMVVVTARNPQPDLLLADQLLVEASLQGIAAALIVNKCDLDEGAAQDILKQYRGIDAIVTSATAGQGIGAMLERLGGNIATLAGQSGVGKTSLVNSLLPGESREVGDISRIERGRHTTRHAELLAANGGFLVDTPGFSLLDDPVREPETLKDHYAEYLPYEGMCRFDGCLHDKEPGCAVKQAAQDGILSAARLERYQALLARWREHWIGRYK